MDALPDEVVRDLGAAAEDVGARVMLVGAQAVGRVAPLPRKTGDADFAVLLETWSHLDMFFDACRAAFADHSRVDLKMYHRRTGVQVDLLPCGDIESPPGTLAVRSSDRVFNNLGVAECFELGSPFADDLPSVLVPPAYALVLLKLFAWKDRDAPKDLRDLGHLLQHAPRDDDAMYADDAFMAALTEGADYDDWRTWQVGRDITRQFSPPAVAAVRGVLAQLREAPEATRALLRGHHPDFDDRLATADRVLDGLWKGVATPTNRR